MRPSSSAIPIAGVRALLVIALLCGIGQARHASAAPIALVTDIAGKAETRVDERTVPVTLLSEFRTGARVRLHPQARMMLLFYGSGELYALAGPSLVRITQAGVEALSGNEPVRQPTLSGRDGKPLLLRPMGVTQAGVVVRSVAQPITALAMTDGTTLDARPVFLWREPEPGLEYRFVLRDGNDTSHLERRLRETTLAMPPEIALADGQRYRWSLSAKSAAGIEYALSHRFSVADAATRDAVANFRPAPDAPTAQRVAYALWLEQAGLGGEARRMWRELVAVGVPVPADRQSQ